MPSKFAPEPAYRHGQAARTAILLCNLGTPEAPTASALRRYLAQFLSDHRVVEIPALIWKPILHGIILRVRPAKSAAKYASVWTPEGSPLKAWTEKQAKLLQGWLGEAGHQVQVRYAMRHRQRVRRCGPLGPAPAPPARAAFHQPLPRRPRLHRRPGPPRRSPLARTRPA